VPIEKCVHCGWSFNRTDPEDDCLCPDCEALVMASFPEPEALVLDEAFTERIREFLRGERKHESQR
jgi:hypothetical protein